MAIGCTLSRRIRVHLFGSIILGNNKHNVNNNNFYNRLLGDREEERKSERNTLKACLNRIRISLACQPGFPTVRLVPIRINQYFIILSSGAQSGWVPFSSYFSSAIFIIHVFIIFLGENSFHFFVEIWH